MRRMKDTFLILLATAALVFATGCADDSPSTETGGAGGSAGAAGEGGAGGEAGAGGAGGAGGEAGAAGEAGGAGEGGTGGSGGVVIDPPDADDSGETAGCSCDVNDDQNAPLGWLGFLGLMVMGLRRRRR